MYSEFQTAIPFRASSETSKSALGWDQSQKPTNPPRVVTGSQLRFDAVAVCFVYLLYLISILATFTLLLLPSQGAP